MMGRKWTTREIAFLKAQVGDLTHAQIARRLNRSRIAVKAFCHVWGFNARRSPLSLADLACIRAAHGKKTARQVAAELGVSVSAVHRAAARLGVATPARRYDAKFAAEVRRLHALGWSDGEVSRELGCERRTVSEWRRRMGLGCNTFSAHRINRVRERTRQQLAAAGLPSLAAVRVKAFRDRARAAGWPEDLRPRAVQILDALWHHGPMTRRQIAETIGMPWKGSRKSLISNDPEGSYLAHLMARGLVVSLGRLVKGRGKGRSISVYSLPLLVEKGQFA